MKKVYNFKLIDFLATRNTIILYENADYLLLVELLKKVGLSNIINFRDFDELRYLVSLNSKDGSKDICLEYDNNKGITFYTNKAKSVEWYEREPYTVKEILDELEIK